MVAGVSAAAAPPLRNPISFSFSLTTGDMLTLDSAIQPLRVLGHY